MNVDGVAWTPEAEMAKGGLAIILCAVLAATGAAAGTARQSTRAAQIKALEFEMGVDFKSRRTLSGYSRQFEDCVAKTGITQELRTCAFREHQRLLRVMNRAYSKKMAALPASPGAPQTSSQLAGPPRQVLQRSLAGSAGRHA